MSSAPAMKKTWLLVPLPRRLPDARNRITASNPPSRSQGGLQLPSGWGRASCLAPLPGPRGQGFRDGLGQRRMSAGAGVQSLSFWVTRAAGPLTWPPGLVSLPFASATRLPLASLSLWSPDLPMALLCLQPVSGSSLPKGKVHPWLVLGTRVQPAALQGYFSPTP